MPIGHYVRNYFPPGAVGGIPGAAAVGGIPGAAAVGGIPGVSSADTDIIRFGIKNKEVMINADEKHVIFFINPPLLVKNKNVY